jgi:hypothetical protein
MLVAALILASPLPFSAAAQVIEPDYEIESRISAKNAWDEYLRTGEIGALKGNRALQYLWRDYVKPEILSNDPGQEKLRSSWIETLFWKWTEKLVGKDEIDLTVQKNWVFAYDAWESKSNELRGIDPVRESVELLSKEVWATVLADASVQERIAEILAGTPERIAVATDMFCDFAETGGPAVDTFVWLLFRNLEETGDYRGAASLRALANLANAGLVEAGMVDAKISEIISSRRADSEVRQLAEDLRNSTQKPGSMLGRITIAFLQGKGRLVGWTGSGSRSAPENDVKDAARRGAKRDIYKIK